MLTALLFLIARWSLYWPATFHEYGLRDDYSNLREAQEEPGKVVQFCASHARPIYGWLLQSTYGQPPACKTCSGCASSPRCCSAAISLVMFRGLRALGWSSEQQSVRCRDRRPWSLPHKSSPRGRSAGRTRQRRSWRSAHSLRSKGSFAMGLRTRKPPGGGSVGSSASACMVVSALIYQPSALFYVGSVGGRAHRPARHRGFAATVRWAVRAFWIRLRPRLGLAYCTMAALYSMGVFVKSGRVAFEQHWVDKIAWFLQEPLPNALSMFVLNDNNQRDHGLYCGCAALVAADFGRGRVFGMAAPRCVSADRLAGRARRAAAVRLRVSLVASERYATYRTILAHDGGARCASWWPRCTR